MGPHFFKCGKLKVRRLDKMYVAGLQWGRTFSSAESGQLHQVDSVLNGGFNGAALFQVRKVQYPIEISEFVEALQWGRTFSSAESLWLLSIR